MSRWWIKTYFIFLNMFLFRVEHIFIKKSVLELNRLNERFNGLKSLSIKIFNQF